MRIFEDENKIKKLAKLINESKKPILYTGGGIVASKATENLRKLIEKSNIPACNTIMGIGNLEYNNRTTLGMVGMHGMVSTNLAVESSDLLIALGVRFSDRVALNPASFAPNAKIFHVDIDPSEIGKNVAVDFSLIGDVNEVLNKLLPLIEKQDRKDWLEQIDEYRKEDYAPTDNDNVLKPHQLLEYVNEKISSSDILVTDVGQHQMWAAQFSGNRDPRTFLTSGGLGTMGFGFGAAMGAKVANPEKQVIHITGDGSFHMNMNEVPTSVANDIKIITLIFNNEALGMPRQWQHHLYNKRFAESDFYRPTNYVKLADAFGGYGFSCSTLEEFKVAFDEALKLDKTV
ncbi:MAG: thiamine pyrophosphate-dependent enzyme, partial [Gallicola sp.]|nr:thiamine pyrophosphate-dependent enzyme [Gallicola sp.]